MCGTWWRVLTHKKRLTAASVSQSQLGRVLNTLDLTALGVGSTLGVGVYVLAGQVAKETAGPSVVVSFLIAAIASVFAGLCYAEFGARVPRAGSAYIYSYVSVGELIAFIIGWNLILEYVIGSASVARGLSLYLDTIFNNTIQDTFKEIAPMHSSFTADYFDFLSFSVSLVLGTALAFGLKESSLVNNVVTMLNIAVVLFVIIAGAFKANPKNWKIPKSDIPPGVKGGEGGFFPFGLAGTIKGAATCFYGFVGFDCIATTGEEVKNPQRAIPFSIIISLLIIFLSYFGTSTVVTLMWPYYYQDPNAPIPHVFAEIGWPVAKWIVTIGGIFGLCASLFGAMYPLPRIIYAMASDALIFKFLGTVSARFQTPAIGTLVAALMTGLMAAIFNLKQLVNMMSIGTLLAYTIVAACVILLRYTPAEETNNLQPSESLESLNLIPKRKVTFNQVMKHIFNFSKTTPTSVTENIIKYEIILFCILSILLSTWTKYYLDDLADGKLWVIITTSVTVLLMVLTLVSMSAQPKSSTQLTFKVPCVPLVPALSICINIYLMMMLDVNTWIRFAIWMAFGIPIYLTSIKLYKIGAPKVIGNGTLNGSAHPIKPSIALTSSVRMGVSSMAVSPGEPETKQFRKPSYYDNEVDDVLRKFEKVLEDSDRSFGSDNASLGGQSTCSTESETAEPDRHHVTAIVHREDTNSPLVTPPTSHKHRHSRHKKLSHVSEHKQFQNKITNTHLHGRNSRKSSINSISQSIILNRDTVNTSQNCDDIKSITPIISANIDNSNAQEEIELVESAHVQNSNSFLYSNTAQAKPSSIINETNHELLTNEINNNLKQNSDETNIPLNTDNLELNSATNDHNENESIKHDIQQEDNTKANTQQNTEKIQYNDLEDNQRALRQSTSYIETYNANMPYQTEGATNVDVTEIPIFIPPPPPSFEDFLKSTNSKSPKSIPPVIKRNVSPPNDQQEDIDDTQSDEDEKPDFIKPSDRKSHFQKKLNKLFSNHPKTEKPNLTRTNSTPSSPYQPEPKPPDTETIPKLIKSIDNKDKVESSLTDPFIPDENGQTVSFKDTLNKLFLQQSNDIKTTMNQTKAKPKKPTNEDHESHKRLMADTFRSIKLRRTGLDIFGHDPEVNKSTSNKDIGRKLDDVPKNNSTKPVKMNESHEGSQGNTTVKGNAEESTVGSKRTNGKIMQDDKIEHKRLMIDTLRHIKLRRTGILDKDHT